MEYKINNGGFDNHALLKTLKAIYDSYEAIGAEVYVVGAAARDIILSLLQIPNAPRRTMDLDVAVMLENWDEYEHLSSILRANGFEKATQRQKFLYPLSSGLEYEVDIVPFGAIASNEEVAWPPEGNPVMSVKCFSDVMSVADTVYVEDGFHFRIASLAGQWLIKLDAWSDRNMMTRKDATDMEFIMENAYVALALTKDRLPEEVSTEATTFDITVAGAEWIASEMKAILTPDHSAYYSNLIMSELSKKEDSRLINDLYDNARNASYDSICKALNRIASILSI